MLRKNHYLFCTYLELGRGIVSKGSYKVISSPQLFVDKRLGEHEISKFIYKMGRHRPLIQKEKKKVKGEGSVE
jgi:hypothetical protein